MQNSQAAHEDDDESNVQVLCSIRSWNTERSMINERSHNNENGIYR